MLPHNQPSPAEHAVPEFAGTARFEILERIGSGGMGVVYRAFDRERQTQVALKCMRNLSAQALVRFKNEFRILQSVSHPNLVRLGELVRESSTGRESSTHGDGEQWFFTMELVEGTNFLSYLRTGECTGRQTATILESAGTSASSEIVSATEAGSANHEEENEQAQSPRIGTDFDEQRLRPALAQLALGLRALHAMGKVHRDVKPSNILVTATGRVVILDFGLITDFVEDRWHDRQLVGTAGYMAPEQAGGTHLGPEADWYSVGALLYLVLTGYRPLGAGGLPPRPRSIDARVPDDLDQLCLGLLATDPARRANGRDVLDVVGASVGWCAESSIGGESTDVNGRGEADAVFIGRGAELAALDQAYQASAHHAVAVFVSGESGIGKSALVDEFLGGVERRDNNALVLKARCYERESAAYKGVDGLVDELSWFLDQLYDQKCAQQHRQTNDHPTNQYGHHSSQALDDEMRPYLCEPQLIGALTRIFPALLRVPTIRKWADHTDKPSKHDQRWQGFAALRQLFENLAKHWRVVISIDDLQWADADSWLLLGELMRAPESPPILLIGTRRNALATETGQVAKQAHWSGDIRTVDVGPLTDKDARNLATTLLGTGQNLDGLLSEAGGHPLILTDLCHFAARHDQDSPPFANPFTQRIANLDPDVQRLLHIVALAGAPMQQQAARKAADISNTDIDAALHQLRSDRLVQTQGNRPTDLVESYHDRIRSIVVADLDAPLCQRYHAAIATVLESESSPEVQRIAVHWARANNHPRAYEYACKAAQKAFQALAFDQAARWYQQAIDLRHVIAKPDTAAAQLNSLCELYTALAESLAGAGRGPEAAQAFRRAAQGQPRNVSVDLEQKAANQLLRSGHIDEGLEAMTESLRAYGFTVPKTPNACQRALLVQRLLLALRHPDITSFETRDANDEELAHIDAVWNAMLGTIMVDHFLGALFHTYSLSLSLKAGDLFRISRSIAMEAYSATQLGEKHEYVDRLLTRVEDIAKQTNDHYLTAFHTLVQAAVMLFRGKWIQANDLALLTDQLVSHISHDVSWERATAKMNLRTTQFWVGLPRESLQEIEASAARALSRGNLYAANAERTGNVNIAWLMADNPKEARRRTQNAMRDWSQEGFFIQHQFDLFATANIELYIGNGIAAHTYIRDRWTPLRHSRMLHAAFNRITMMDVFARTALGATYCGDTSALRDAKKAAARLCDESADWARALAKLIRAQIAHFTNAPDTVDRFEHAAQALAQCDMRYQTAAALACHDWLTRGVIHPDTLDAPCLTEVKKPIQFLTIFAPALRPMVGL